MGDGIRRSLRVSTRLQHGKVAREGTIATFGDAFDVENGRSAMRSLK